MLTFMKKGVSTAIFPTGAKKLLKTERSGVDSEADC